MRRGRNILTKCDSSGIEEKQLRKPSQRLLVKEEIIFLIIKSISKDLGPGIEDSSNNKSRIFNHLLSLVESNLHSHSLQICTGSWKILLDLFHLRSITLNPGKNTLRLSSKQ